MSDKIGTELDGVITGVENFGLFVMGTEIPAEGFVHISSLTDDYYRYDRAGHVIAGHRTGNSFRLGDTVRVVGGGGRRRHPQPRLPPGRSRWRQEKPRCAAEQVARKDRRARPKQKQLR